MDPRIGVKHPILRSDLNRAIRPKRHRPACRWPGPRERLVEPHVNAHARAAPLSARRNYDLAILPQLEGEAILRAANEVASVDDKTRDTLDNANELEECPVLVELCDVSLTCAEETVPFVPVNRCRGLRQKERLEDFSIADSVLKHLIGVRKGGEPTRVLPTARRTALAQVLRQPAALLAGLSGLKPSPPDRARCDVSRNVAPSSQHVSDEAVWHGVICGLMRHLSYRPGQAEQPCNRSTRRLPRSGCCELTAERGSRLGGTSWIYGSIDRRMFEVRSPLHEMQCGRYRR